MINPSTSPNERKTSLNERKTRVALSGGRGGGSLGAYLAWALFGAVPLAVVAWTGGLFPRSRNRFY